MKKIKHLKKNTILKTKDGRVIGNAIIRDWDVNLENYTVIYTIMTDYGNVVKWTAAQVKAHFRVAKYSDKSERDFAQETHKHYTP